MRRLLISEKPHQQPPKRLDIITSASRPEGTVFSHRDLLNHPCVVPYGTAGGSSRYYGFLSNASSWNSISDTAYARTAWRRCHAHVAHRVCVHIHIRLTHLRPSRCHTNACATLAPPRPPRSCCTSVRAHPSPSLRLVHHLHATIGSSPNAVTSTSTTHGLLAPPRSLRCCASKRARPSPLPPTPTTLLYECVRL